MFLKVDVLMTLHPPLVGSMTLSSLAYFLENFSEGYPSQNYSKSSMFNYEVFMW